MHCPFDNFRVLGKGHAPSQGRFQAWPRTKAPRRHPILYEILAAQYEKEEEKEGVQMEQSNIGDMKNDTATGLNDEEASLRAGDVTLNFSHPRGVHSHADLA